MPRFLTLIGAPTSLGIRPYDDGTPRRLFEAPRALRDAGLGAALHAKDDGDVVPEPYRDFARPPGRPRNEPEVQRYSRALAERVSAAIGRGEFPVVIGGDCSIVLGGLWGAHLAARAPVALAYLDGHADFATPAESRTGSVASMCLGLAVGRGETPLARLTGPALVADRHVALVGRRDEAEPWYGHAALEASAVLDLPDALARVRGFAACAEDVLQQVAAAEVDGFWIHFDADVLAPEVMPAVDSPVPGGPTLEEAVSLLTPLVHHPKAIGFELTIYDPGLDLDGVCARTLVTLLEDVFRTSS